MKGWLVTVDRDFDDPEACIVLAATPEEARDKAYFSVHLDDQERQEYCTVEPLPACDGKERITSADYLAADCWIECEACSEQIDSDSVEEGRGFVGDAGQVWCLTHAPVSVRRVVNVRSGEPYDVYVGRANKRYGLPQSPWANPFKVGPDGERWEVINRYVDWIHQQPDLMARLPELRGKVLGCWCAPAECHADVLVALANTNGGPR